MGAERENHGGQGGGGIPSRGWARWRWYASIYKTLWANSVVREMSFKSNFLLWIVVELLWFALQLTFVSVIYRQTERIADWTRWEVMLLVGVSHFIQQLFTALFLGNCTAISEHVRTGRLDFMLLLPIDTRFLVSLRQVDLGAFFNAASALGVVVYACRKLGLVPGAAQLVGFGILCGVGVLIHYCLMYMLASVSFWTVRAQGVVWGYYNLFNIARLPDAAFEAGWFRRVFTFVLPMILVSNVPAKVLLSKLGQPGDMALLLAMAALCWLASEWVWRKCLRQYTSASS